MIFTIPLHPATVLANVRFYWLAGGVPGAPQSIGITQPDLTFPLFEIASTPPANAEELIAYDNTNAGNWNVGQYKSLLAAQGLLPTLNMVFTVPLRPATVLGNVRFYWLAGGVVGATQSTGITQPDATFPMFEITSSPPVNADELVVWDVTNTANWNVGQYKQALVGTAVVTPPTHVCPDFPFRTVNFRKVWESIIRRHGLDPIVHIEHDIVRSVVERINDRMATAWIFWEWPQLSLLEERAFRTTWTSLSTFFRVGCEGVPDEVYYPIDGNYYRVLSTAPIDPPAGTLPTNTTYYTRFDISDRYILLDQVGQRPMDGVIAIFDTDPRLSQHHYATKLPFRPTEREVTLTWAGTGNTVFVLFTILTPQFTMALFLPGRTYKNGDTVFEPADGDCYMANQDSPSGGPASQPTMWNKLPFPAIFRRFVVAGAYADGLRETDPVENDPVQRQIRNTKIQIADAEAEGYLQQEVDRLIQEGQAYRYGQQSPIKYSMTTWRASFG